MTRQYRTLSSFDDVATVAQPPEAAALESDYVVILAALLCALICLVGLISVARCAWLRRGSVAGSQTPNQQYANRGIKKKTIEALPKFAYDDKSCGKLSSVECAICLGDYVNGDEIRVLPQCGHRFHVGCIDTWLSAHSSCPSCRQVLVARRCKKCGEFPTVAGGSVVELEAGDKCRQHNGTYCSTDYLP